MSVTDEPRDEATVSRHHTVDDTRRWNAIWGEGGWVRHKDCPNARDAGQFYAVHSIYYHDPRPAEDSPTLRVVARYAAAALSAIGGSASLEDVEWAIRKGVAEGIGGDIGLGVRLRPIPLGFAVEVWCGNVVLKQVDESSTDGT